MDLNAKKGISLIIFFLITIGAGALPILLYKHCRRQVHSRRGQNVLCLLNCFAGGVFLATCLLNLLLEGLEEYEEFREVAGFHCQYPFFHLGIAAGFFLVALVERVAVCLSVHYPAMKEEIHGKEEEKGGGSGNGSERGKRGDHFKHSRNIMKAPARAFNSDVELTAVRLDINHPETRSDLGSEIRERPIRSTGTDKTRSSICRSPEDAEREEEEEGGEEKERFSATTGLRAVVLLLALSFHTIFDGLAVGLQDSDAGMWTTTAAISVHKAIVTVSLGLELVKAMGHRPLLAFLLLFVFSLMAPIGLVIGMGITSGHVDERAHLLAGSMLQAVATGSFLYVTFFEVLAEELGRDSSVLKIIVTAVGFAAVAVAKIWDTD